MNTLISASEINNNFSKASSIVEKEGIAIVTKNNKPKFVILNFKDYEKLISNWQLQQKIDKTADRILDENIEAFFQLAKWLNKSYKTSLKIDKEN